MEQNSGWNGSQILIFCNINYYTLHSFSIDVLAYFFYNSIWLCTLATFGAIAFTYSDVRIEAVRNIYGTNTLITKAS